MIGIFLGLQVNAWNQSCIDRCRKAHSHCETLDAQAISKNQTVMNALAPNPYDAGDGLALDGQLPKATLSQ